MTIAVKLGDRFTLAQYEAYAAQEDWQFDLKADGQPFENEAEWNAHWWDYIEARLRESRSHSRPTKEEWARALRRFEVFADRNRQSPTSADPGDTHVPFTYMGVSNRVALLCDSLPRPIGIARQAAQDQWLAGLNYNMNWELDAEEFDLSIYDVVLESEITNIGTLKFSIDKNQSGPQGKPGRITFRPVDSRHMHFDPLGKHPDWKYLRWFINAEPYDLDEIRAIFPDKGALVDGELYYSTPISATDEEGSYGAGVGGSGVIQSPTNIGISPQGPGIRSRAVVKELWLKDASMKFEATEDETDNTYINDDGEVKLADAEKPPTYTECKVDSDGYVEGNWVRRFPHGRRVIGANKVILSNCENPYSANIPPYAFLRGPVITKQLLAPGVASHIMITDRKLNDMLIRMMHMAQANIERPTICDLGAFDAPKRWSEIEFVSDLVLQLRSAANNRTMYKLEAGEIPAFIMPLYAQFEKLYNEQIAIPGVMKGQLVEGAQVGTETMNNLQESSAAQLRMAAKFLEHFLKKCGYLLMWFIFDAYPDSVPVPVYDSSSGQQGVIPWPKAGGRDEYAIEIEAGSSLPGAKQGAYKQAIELKKNDCMDPEGVLDAAKWPGKDKVLARLKKEKKEALDMAEQAKAEGVNLKEVKKAGGGDGKPGRRGK